MGFYAAPLHNEVDAALESGYTPPSGLSASNFSVTVVSAGKFKYQSPLYIAVNATLESGYTAPSGSASTAISVILQRPLETGGSRTIYATGVSDSGVGLAPSIRNIASIVSAAGISTEEFAPLFIWLRWQHVFATHKAHAYANAVLVGSYSAPDGYRASASLQRYGTFSRIGRPGVANYFQSIRPPGISGHTVGMPAVRDAQRRVYPSGWNSATVPSPMVVDTAVKPAGISPLSPGRPAVFNLRQYVVAVGASADHYGFAYVQGGVKVVGTTGLHSLAIGALALLNTRADQTAKPSGVEAPGMGAVNVSPRILRPAGVHGTTAGIPRVQFPPQPLGWVATAFGHPIIDYKTKAVFPGGIHGYASGFPRIADRARKVLHSASAVTSVFGDVQVRAKNSRVVVHGLLSLQMPPWTEVRNTRRIVDAVGIPAPSAGIGPRTNNKTPSIGTAGFDAQQFGRAGYMVVGWRIRSIAPSGVPTPFPSSGMASLWQPPSFMPAGIASPAFPGPSIWPAVRPLEAIGREALLTGVPTVGFAYRIIRSEGHGINGAAWGRPCVEHERRGIDVLGASFMVFGSAWVSRGLRALAPFGITDPLLSLHHIGGMRYLGPEGFESMRWLTRVIPESREVFPKAFGAAYGLAMVQNRKSYLRPAGVTTYQEPAQHWGTARVWNLRQVVTMYEDQSSGLWPLPWPQWTSIENRDRTPHVTGFNAGRVAAPVVANNARLTAPSSIPYPALHLYQKTGMVSHRVRRLPLDGIEPPLMARWVVVHNGARLVNPPGFVATGFGMVQAVNTRRLYGMQGFYSAAPGYPFVAPRIRELTFESRYGIQPPRIDLPWVQLNSRYLEAASIDQGGVGSAELRIFFRRITPRWTLKNFFGDPVVRNKTPEVKTRGRVSEGFGDAQVRLEWRPIKADGASMEVFGNAKIADRKQVLTVPGMNHMAVSDKVTVRRFGEQPVMTQYIELRAFVTDALGAQIESDVGHGIPYPVPPVGFPDLLKGYIFHGKGAGQNHDMLSMGSPTITANSIRVEPGIFDFYIGEPFVALRKRQVDTASIGQLVMDSSDNGNGMGSWGKPRISPHTIYAVMEATPQAMRNHAINKETLRPVHESVTFGELRVSQWNGAIKPMGIASSGALGSVGATWGVGNPKLINKRQCIAPNGALMQRIGWPVIPGPQYIFIEEPVTGYAMGLQRVSRPPYTGPLFIPVGSAAYQEFGRPMVDHRHRIVLPSAWVSQVMGSSMGESTLYMPQALHVGPRMPTIPKGFDASMYGTSWVSRRVRGIEPDGHDSFLSEYDYQAFEQRMRVRNSSDSWGGRRPVSTHGHKSSRVGAPGVRLGAHYIRPDGNSDQYRKGAF